MSWGRAPDDFRPTANWEVLRLRAELLRVIRQFFDERQFLEVETPILSADTVVDRHLDPFWTADVNRPADITPQTRLYFLQTSPEFGMKRLLAAGSPKAIYQISRVFRRGECGPLHNPEFTLVEWYRVGDDYHTGMDLLAELCEVLFGRGRPKIYTYGEVFTRFVGIDPYSAAAEQLRQRAEALGVAYPASLSLEDRDGWLDLLFTEKVQPHLGQEEPVIICDYPASQAALAIVRKGPPSVAERFELFVNGIELANGYHELRDPEELRQRITTANAQRVRDGKSPLPPTNRLLQAMEAGLPACVGVALGFDRVVMIRAGANSIREVLAFPFDRA
ncbi:MAG: EF-P lysine aminoacylase EpmA [Thermogutta sp.]|nr:EF-P lysine aminoacylase EpmA [Thermogutta sp.]